MEVIRNLSGRRTSAIVYRNARTMAVGASNDDRERPHQLGSAESVTGAGGQTLHPLTAIVQTTSNPSGNVDMR